MFSLNIKFHTSNRPLEITYNNCILYEAAHIRQRQQHITHCIIKTKFLDLLSFRLSDVSLLQLYHKCKQFMQ